MDLVPNSLTSFPGGRIVFSIQQGGSKFNISELHQPVINIFFPSEEPYVSAINMDNDTFSWIVPPKIGSYDGRIHIQHADGDEWFDFSVQINPVRANRFTLETSPEMDATGNVNVQIYDPVGTLVYFSPMSYDGYVYSASTTPDNDWIAGEYSATVTDDTGVIDVLSAWVERPSLVTMREFYGLPEWQRQIIEFIKYDMFSDTEPLAPAAFFTLEEYARFWKATVREINSITPKTNVSPEGLPPMWADVMMKGTFINVCNALATRSVTVPRWTNNDMPMRDESHLQQAWETRAQALKPDYEEERAYLKGDYLPGPLVTVDPFMGMVGGSLAGSSALSIIGKPSWFTSLSGGSLR